MRLRENLVVYTSHILYSQRKNNPNKQQVESLSSNISENEVEIDDKSSEKLKETLSLISHVRKFVVLKFTPSELSVILINGQAVKLEPQVWCKLPVSELFQSCEIQSVRDNTILMEINIDLLVQTLKNFDKANSEGLNIRLQRTDTSGAKGTSTTTGRTASLALFILI